MVKVAVLADAPMLTTGFGRTTSRMAQALVRADYGVAVFGLKARPEDMPELVDGYEIWPAERGGHWTRTLGAFFADVAADVLIMNMDAANAPECLDACAAAGWDGPTVSYVCFDGLPVDDWLVDAQRRCDAVWTTSQCAGAFLRSRGIEVRRVAPPGVDLDEFRTEPDREAGRARAGLSGATVVGVFATNTERKQVARAIEGFAGAIERLPGDSRLYLHCRAEGYRDLAEDARAAGIAEHVLFAGDAAFDEQRGLPTIDYVGRLNLCDVIVNVPHSGDVEQVILEAQACEVPLLHTADGGVMSEALGDGGIGLPAADVQTGEWGQPLHLVDPATIADAIVRVVDDKALAAELRRAGRANARRYSWDVLESAARDMVQPFAEVAGS